MATALRMQNKAIYCESVFTKFYRDNDFAMSWTYVLKDSKKEFDFIKMTKKDCQIP